ncbi:MAG: hypothetical protein LBH16_04645 [Treponema sp.]|jgi:xylulokinase|nr:hypothetical protein [Treponema sp.]
MLLTIDIGTSIFKSALWDLDGNRLSFASAALSVNKCGLKYEAVPSMWLRAFEECCHKLLSDLKRQSNVHNGGFAGVRAIVLSGNGPSLVPVFKEPDASDWFSPLAGNAWLWLEPQMKSSRMDEGPQRESSAFEPQPGLNTEKLLEYSSEVSALMGGFVDSCFFLPKILSIKNDEAGLYHKTKYFLGCPEYLAYALTGEAKTVFPSDGFDRWFWNDSVLEKLKLDADKFPPFIRPGDPFGNILPSAARRFGFAENIPVISGGPDFFASILGSGVTEPGQICDRTGSSDGINICVKDHISHEKLMSYGHPVKPYWNLSGVINTTGMAIQWCRDLLGLSGFHEFFSLAKESGPGSGSLVFLPYLAGSRAGDSVSRGLWRGLTLSSGRSELANSVLEGICFAIRDIITVMEESGAAAEQLHVTGGLAGNAALNQMKADITGRPALEPALKEAELLGLAVIGACFLGKFSSYREASGAMCAVQRRFEPNPENARLYNDFFVRYKQERCLN